MIYEHNTGSVIQFGKTLYYFPIKQGRQGALMYEHDRYECRHCVKDAKWEAALTLHGSMISAMKLVVIGFSTFFLPQVAVVVAATFFAALPWVAWRIKKQKTVPRVFNPIVTIVLRSKLKKEERLNNFDKATGLMFGYGGLTS